MAQTRRLGALFRQSLLITGLTPEDVVDGAAQRAFGETWIFAAQPDGSFAPRVTSARRARDGFSLAAASPLAQALTAGQAGFTFLPLAGEAHFIGATPIVTPKGTIGAVLVSAGREAEKLQRREAERRATMDRAIARFRTEIDHALAETRQSGQQVRDTSRELGAQVGNAQSQARRVEGAAQDAGSHAAEVARAARSLSQTIATIAARADHSIEVVARPYATAAGSAEARMGGIRADMGQIGTLIERTSGATADLERIAGALAQSEDQLAHAIQDFLATVTHADRAAA